MKFGDWDVQSIVAARFRLDGGAMFGVVPKNLWSRVASHDEQNRIYMAMRLMVIRGQGKTILVDAGAGDGYGDKFDKIYAMEGHTPMDQCLGQIGLKPEEVTDVIATHLHFDHAGGVVTSEGDGVRLTFPNAVHHVQKTQWEHALAPNPRDQASYFHERIEIMEREGVLELHHGEWSLAPGIEMHTCHGHTPGQQLPRVIGDGRSIFYCGDLIPTSAHFPAPYIMSYDLQPVLAMDEKTAILERAANEGWILFFEHDPEVAACGVRQEDGRFVPGDALEL